MMSPARLHEVLAQCPFPGATVDAQTFAIAIDGFDLHYLGCEWRVGARTIPTTWPAFDSPDDGDRVHAEIRRVLAIVNAPAEPAPSWEQTKEDCVGPDLPDDDPLYDRSAAAQALAKVTAERDAALAAPAQRLALLDDLLTRLGAKSGGALEALDRLDLTIETLRGERDKIARERDAERIRWGDQIQDRDTRIRALEVEGETLRADLAKMTDAHAVVSQRLVGAQKEAAEVSAERDEATARADKVEDRLRRDDELRQQIAVAVGLDDSASLALILETVTRDRPARELSRLSGLLDVLAAPVTFGERRLTTAERAEWALRRWLAEGKECSARMAQLIEAEVLLDCMGVPAYAAVPNDDPGDASEALTVAERLRLYFGARS